MSISQAIALDLISGRLKFGKMNEICAAQLLTIGWLSVGDPISNGDISAFDRGS
jgi:hypothetical protein